jgi:hypothetical protein
VTVGDGDRSLDDGGRWIISWSDWWRGGSSRRGGTWDGDSVALGDGSGCIMRGQSSHAAAIRVG